MDDWLIFQYHFIRAQAESELLRGWLPSGSRTDPLGGGQRWGDAGGYVDPGDGRPGVSA